MLCERAESPLLFVDVSGVSVAGSKCWLSGVSVGNKCWLSE